MKLWTRLWGWLERHLPDLTGDCGTDDETDLREPGEAYCRDCPDPEACFTGYPCGLVKRTAS